MIARFASALLICFGFVWSAAAAEDMTLTVTLEDLPQPPFEDEMVLLTIHGEYTIPITLEKLEQPDLSGFDWMQLGEDSWYDSRDTGRKVVNFKRVMALFPNRAGTLEIAPFVHKLELVTKAGKRYKRDIKSRPVSIEVLPKPEGVAWWLPARKIEVEDNWSNPPDQLGAGEGALRVVTVTVHGVKPSQVPPMPDLQAAGAFVFPHPEVEFTRLRAWGPATRVFWRWTVRPEKPPSAYLKPLSIPYFDTVDRQHKEIVIAAQRIAMTDEAIAEFGEETGMAVLPERAHSSASKLHFAGAVVPIALVAGFLGGLAFMGPSFRRRGILGLNFQFLRRDPNRTALNKAVSRGNAAAARAAAERLLREDGHLSAEGYSVLADFDRSVFSKTPEKPNLRAFKDAVVKALTA